MPRRPKVPPPTDFPHIRLYAYVTTSDAWHSLTPLARALLIQIWVRHTGTNNGDIGYSIREAKKEFHCGDHQASRAFNDLQDRGFIVRHRCATYDGKVGRATRWRLTAEPLSKMNPATHDYMNGPPKPEG